MTRNYRLREGRLLVFFFIVYQLCTVSECRHYEKCITRDGRPGVCVLKRFCREANHHELRPCFGDGENHCCPIPTTQRSAPNPEWPDIYNPEPVEKNKQHSGIPREPERENGLSKTPSPRGRGSPTRHGSSQPKRPPAIENDYESGRHRPIQPLDVPQEIFPAKDSDVDEVRPSARPTNSNRQGNPSRRPGNNPVHPTKARPDTARNPGSGRENPPRHNSDQPSVAPIRFPGSHESSVPSPKVPECGVKPYDLFIAGGEQSGEHEWPWMTAIFRRYSDSRPKMFLCGGSLINTKYVLTAAHCFVNNYVILPASSFVVRLGSHFLNSGDEYTVSNLVLHHNHSGSDFFNDIALVRLASPVYVTDKIAPICLPDPGMMRDNLVGLMATVSGWGDTSFRTSQTRILQHVTVPIVSGEECFAAYSRVRGAAFLARGSDHVICAGLREGGKDACLGDSGGPLMLKMPDDRYVIIGIVSLGYKCAEPGYPGVYTRVTHYMSWINTNMKP